MTFDLSTLFDISLRQYDPIGFSYFLDHFVFLSSWLSYETAECFLFSGPEVDPDHVPRTEGNLPGLTPHVCVSY